MSHAYSEPGLQSDLVELNRLVRLKVVAPDTAKVLVFEGHKLEAIPEARHLIAGSRRIPLVGTQHFLADFDLGVRRFSPDVLHVDYEPWSAIYWQVLAVRRALAPSARILVSIKKNTYRRYAGVLGGLKSGLALQGVKRASGIVSASEIAASLAVETMKVGRSRIAVVPHLGVDTGRFTPRPDADLSDPPVIGYCGPFENYKGVFDLVEAVRLLNVNGLACRLTLVGGGSLGPVLKRLGTNVEWLSVEGLIPHQLVSTHMRRWDVYVAPSRVLPHYEEHDAHAVAEALACGTPVVATRSGILPEMIDERLGTLTRPQDPVGLAQAIRNLLADSPRLARIRQDCRREALALYSSRAVATEKAKIYHAVASRAM